ncbi:pyridoxine 5'-phosphate synthase [Pararhizobium mangrovi]|uniref:Pyridoxine 5'-phosphate synthase n=1 Tax=Pararhizobium mangrovi TaxID=2590452 RepID=A0A506UHZ5_9HYPH|nr:pyridoxine 5'-phosphate synthase [Pararhizobium mangrovi]TPW32918.1 pyridoxine 5'-phosphate synthase [Pararhizobium mangrovi]
MPAQLSVNLNAVAMLRNRRDLPWPNLVHLGRIALRSGAHGLTVHPRPDQRHVRFSDLPDLRALIDDEFPEAEFNIEGYPSEPFIELVERIEPDQVTLVPDDPSQATSDHGWDFWENHDFLKPVVARLKRAGMRVSLFADAGLDEKGMRLASETGTDRIELYTGPYGATHDDPAAAEAEIERLGITADAAAGLGLGVNAGHDLTVENLPPLAARIANLAEVSIGHGLTADALEFGMAKSVRRFVEACRPA